MEIFQKTPSIRLKIILLVLFSIIVLILTIYAISTLIISKNYLFLEKASVSENLQRVSDTLDNTASGLTVSVTDWAFWDDTYQFIQDKNEDYISSNLSNSSLSNLKIAGMIFVNAKDEILFKKMIDFETLEEISSENIGTHVIAHKELTTLESLDSSIQGVVALPEGPVLISSRPILKSNAEGPIQGNLIFIKFLDNEMIEALEKLTHLSVKLYNFDSITIPEDVSGAKQELLKGTEKYFINPLSEDLIAGYAVINDIYGAPILIIKVEVPRQIYKQGQFSLNFFSLAVLVFMIFFGLIFIFLLQKFIVRRLFYLSNEVKKISIHNDL